MTHSTTDEASSKDDIYFYHVTAKRPDSVLHAIKCQFTGNTDLNLLLNKGSHFEIYLVTRDQESGEGQVSLNLVMDVPVNGRIATFQTCRPQGYNTDLLVFTTEKYQLSVISFAWSTLQSSTQPASGQIITHATGSIRDPRSRPAETGQIGLLDPSCCVAGFYLTQGLFKLVPIYTGDQLSSTWKSFEDGKKNVSATMNAKGKQILRGPSVGDFGEAFNVRLDKLMVVTMAFLYSEPSTKPQLAVLYQDGRQERHIIIYDVHLTNRELVDTGKTTIVEANASLLIPVPISSGGGVLVVGENSISYVNGDITTGSGSSNSIRKVGLSMRPTVIKAYHQIDEAGRRYLLHGYDGTLYILALFLDANGSVNDIKMDALGETVQPSTVTYLSDGYVFVGSHFGDAELIHLSTTPDDSGSCIGLRRTFSNLSPITDICLVDLEKQGQSQIVACCGAQKNASIRVIRNGVGIEEIGELEDVGEIRGVWALRETYASLWDQLLVMSFIGETRIQKMGEEALEEVEESHGFVTSEATLQCGTVQGDFHVQVTATAVRVVACDSFMCTSEWISEQGAKITQAAINDEYVIISVGGTRLYCLSFQSGILKVINSIQVDLEVACIDIAQINLHGSEKKLCAIGFWTEPSVSLYTVPAFERLTNQSLPGDTIPRSILLTTFEFKTHLMVAMGDGQLFHFNLDTHGNLQGMKRVTLGTQPISLKQIRSPGLGQDYIFASCDRPTFIYSRGGRLCFSNVNLRHVSSVSRFHTPFSENAIAISTEGALKIGCIETMQKLHVKTYPIQETCRKIVYNECHKVFGVLCCRPPNAGTDTREKWFFRILDSQSFEVIHSYELGRNEMGMSLATFEGGSGNSYFLVGTGLVVPHEDEPSAGRLLVFDIQSQHMEMIHERPLKGCAYAVSVVRGKIVAGVNSKVHLFNWVPHSKMLDPVCTHHGHVLALCITVRGDFVIVGDLMKSMCVLLLSSDGTRLDEIARDYDANWMTALEAIDDDIYIGAENHYNLFALKKRSEAESEDERKHLQVVGRFHLGEMVNRFQKGSLVMQTPDQTPLATPELLYCTVSGSIGVIATLKPDDYMLLLRLQSSMLTVVQAVGHLDHALYRQFQNDLIVKDMARFIDGDLIELFAELDPEDQSRVVKNIGLSVDYVSRIVEDLIRIH